MTNKKLLMVKMHGRKCQGYRYEQILQEKAFCRIQQIRIILLIKHIHRFRTKIPILLMIENIL